jgi:tRNA(Met) cytidine acetyltransferase
MSDNHRHCYILKGSPSEVLSDFLRLSENFTTPLIAAYDVSQYNSALLSSATPFTTCSFKQAKQALGSSYDAILVDLTHGVSASALAILSGTVRGGGLFAIALPDDDWLSMTDLDLSRYLPWPYEPEQVPSNFKRYLLTTLQDETSPFKWVYKDQNKTSLIAALPALPAIEANAALTQEQADAQSCLLAEQAQSYVLMAPRGRGKSTLLGDSLAKLFMAGKRVAITAPNQDAIVSLKARFEDFVDIKTATLPFFAPDALINDSSHWDFLFVDEAAMIPLPMLMALNEKAKHCLFSTTDYGYEGAGKGFGIRFCDTLARQKTTQALALQMLVLDQPIRWGGNDPLEKWINDCFFLAAPESTIETPQHEHKTSVQASPTFKRLTGVDWLANTHLLAETFQLLVSAHYQTSPDNLRWILDDPSVSTCLALVKGKVQSVAIVTEEGILPSALSLEVMQGKRRPRGHLVPQSLLAHEGIAQAGEYRYWRISRIATVQNQQNQGLASLLLAQLERLAPEQCDFLCTSFAATPDVVSFWRKNAYTPIRLGTAKDQSSGSYSLMMIKPMTEEASKLATTWQTRFIEHFLLNLLLQYADLPTDLILLILKQNHDQQKNQPALVQLSPLDLQDIALFVEHHRPLDSIRSVFLKAMLSLALQGLIDPNDPTEKLAFEAALGRDIKQTLQKTQLSGKKAIHQSFKSLLKKTLLPK